MSLRTVAARAASRGPLAEAGRRLALEVARRIRIGQLTVLLPDGTRQVVGTPGGPVGELHIHDTAAAWRMILNGEMGAGEAYMDGAWSSHDLPAILQARSAES